MRHQILLLIPFFFLLACTPAEETGADNASVENLSFNETAFSEPAPLPAGSCFSGWKCLGKWYKAHQSGNCSWSQKTECPLGCENGTCRAGQICLSGFKCLDEAKLGYQTETCLWINTKTCEGGCLNGECLAVQPKNETEEASQPPQEASLPDTAPQEEIFSLGFGEEQTLEINGGKHYLKIYLIEPDRIRLVLDDLKSDWLSDKSNFTFSNGVTLGIKNIFYQPYAGGKQVVEYVVR